MTAAAKTGEAYSRFQSACREIIAAIAASP